MIANQLVRVLRVHRPDVPEDGLAHELGALLAVARARWPTSPGPRVLVDDAAFLSHVARHLPSPLPTGDIWSGLRFDELYLAHACAQGEARALRAFDDDFLALVPQYVASLRQPADIADDVRQLARERLLLRGERESPRIADYSGRGPLGGWVRMAVLRIALNYLDARVAHAAEPDAESLSVAAPGQDPEMDCVRALAREDFTEALRVALAELEPRERTLLRLYYAERLSMDQVASLLGCSKSSVSRRLDVAQTEVRHRMRAALAAKAQLTPSEVQSVARVLQSRLELSLGALLRARAP